MNKSQTLFFTGHRDLGDYSELRELLKNTITAFINKGYKYFVAGGALGFDTLAADCILELKAEGKEIELILMLPCKNQADRWSPAAIRKYQGHLKAADRVIYVSETYTKSCMFVRNRAMTDASSVCVAYCNKTDGGTAYTLKYASTLNLTVINLADVER
ncbi:MAG: DUF1273 family protein [Clostridia bacterium]|nr:DUF1273 family protein [Clostridia bacterium]